MQELEDTDLKILSKAFDACWESLGKENKNILSLNPIFKITKNESQNVMKFGRYSCPAFFVLFNNASLKGISHSLIAECVKGIIDELNKYFVTNNIEFSKII